MAKKSKRILVALAFTLGLPLLSGANSPKSQPIEVTTGSPRDILDAPKPIDIYFDYPGVMTGISGSTFFANWKRGDWGVKIRIKDSSRVRDLAALLDEAPVVGQVASVDDRNRFLGGVRIVITTGARDSTYFVNGCRFVRTGHVEVFRIVPSVQQYFLPFNRLQACS